ncbi:hypothetical protein BDZ89DRAFT_954644 [Hymenopellis radicata]|nr:hypothetical protein BDZ89DRAFT_954644 [Hymenopellis radicata]
MTGIGPELPPHLRTQNSHGDNDDEDGPVPGPQIPAELLGARQNEDDDDYAPSLPPDLLASRKAVVPAKQVKGPTLPSAYCSDDDSDDDVGPRPLPSTEQWNNNKIDGVQQFLEKEERRRQQIEEASKPKAVQRDEWMLRPPTSSELLANLDPTKMNRPRQFARSAAPAPKNTDSNLWTETPAERQQRLADEVSGKRRRVVNAEDAVSPEEALEARKKRKRDENIRKGVDEHTRKVRGSALVEEHTKGLAGKKDEDDDPSKAIWDHSRDMSLGGRLMDDGKRNKMLHEAKGLGDRFGTGTSGGFL